jgi:hypothetical protein
MKLVAFIIITAFLALTCIAATAGNTDRRCNTAARYQAMSEGADCFPPDFSKRVPSHRPNRRHHR